MCKGIVLHVTNDLIYIFYQEQEKHIKLAVEKRNLSQEVSSNISKGDEIIFEKSASSTSNNIIPCNIQISKPKIHAEYLDILEQKLKGASNMVYMPMSKVIMYALAASSDINPLNFAEDFGQVYNLRLVGIGYHIKQGKKLFEPIIIFTEC